MESVPKGEVRMPEVLIQAHSSALSAAFYDGDAFLPNTVVMRSSRCTALTADPK